MTRALLLSVVVFAAPALADEALQANLDPALRGEGSLTDRGGKQRPRMVSLFAGSPAWYFGWGGAPLSVGARYLHPILHNGLVPDLNDSISLEVGADFVTFSSRSFAGMIAIPIEAMWAFHFSSRFAAYVKAGIAVEVRFGSWVSSSVADGRGVYPGPVAQLGGWYKFTSKMSLRLEAGYPGVKVGLGFDL